MLKNIIIRAKMKFPRPKYRKRKEGKPRRVIGRVLHHEESPGEKAAASDRARSEGIVMKHVSDGHLNEFARGDLPKVYYGMVATKKGAGGKPENLAVYWSAEPVEKVPNAKARMEIGGQKVPEADLVSRGTWTMGRGEKKPTKVTHVPDEFQVVPREVLAAVENDVKERLEQKGRRGAYKVERAEA